MNPIMYICDVILYLLVRELRYCTCISESYNCILTLQN